MNQPLVTFAIINCNRLFYAKCCYESIIETTRDYVNKEFIFVDNASIEQGTNDFLLQLETQGVKVVRNPVRDPNNEFARGLNKVCELARGDVIIPLQGDMQFVAEGWLEQYVQFFDMNVNVGCVTLDAQRAVTLANADAQHKFIPVGDGFVFDLSRPPLAGAGDVAYRADVLRAFLPWSENNLAHEGGSDSETEFLQRSQLLIRSHNVDIKCAVPLVPAAIAIYTDPRGTNARVRGNRRYGQYWPPKDKRFYYKLHKYSDLQMKALNRSIPLSIEEIAHTIGFDKPVNESGGWLKNPIKPELALPGDWVELEQSNDLHVADMVSVTTLLDDEVEIWLNS